MEATKFRPREVVNHVLQTAAASLKKSLTLEGHVADDVPIEVKTVHVMFLFNKLRDETFYDHCTIPGYRRCPEDSTDPYQLAQVL